MLSELPKGICVHGIMCFGKWRRGLFEFLLGLRGVAGVLGWFISYVLRTLSGAENGFGLDGVINNDDGPIYTTVYHEQ